MKLAEALVRRSDLMKRYEELSQAARDSARYQEGEDAPENPAELINRAHEALTELETLITRINVTNSATEVREGLTLTAALARRDVLKLRHKLLSSVAQSAAGRSYLSSLRATRSELRMISAISASDLRDQADSVAQELRELDLEIQQKGWEVSLLP